ncbi:hypothetical protein [Legionella spiritensis]|uniref:hypothetical protein n=1 Tax=Legionella spiritensis TaxID=452 RepID=UPI000F7121BD|nr:hypothetical protein [Legionella spiritensis]VEG90863.1 Dot/Icm T4SS effector [Legionella spiritensis]
MLLVQDIINGQDITEHYLDNNQKEFKIFRHEKNVYAVRYDEKTKEPVDFVHMWVSHRYEFKEKPPQEEEKLGRGVEGVVLGKTADKAIKKLNVRKKSSNEEKEKEKERKIEKNMDILKQKFILSEHHIEKHFVMGLWNIKDKDNYLFIMPKVQKKDKDDRHHQAQDELILALKKLNELGLSHPDYANSPFHTSFQNEIYTDEGLKLFDLDSGFKKYNNEENKKAIVHGRDQWLYVYNHKNSPTGPKGSDRKWRDVLRNWYNENEGKSLSDNPHALLRFYNEETISLPKTVVRELQEKINKFIISGTSEVDESSGHTMVKFSNPDKLSDFIQAITYLNLSLASSDDELRSDKPLYKMTENGVLFTDTAWELVQAARTEAHNQNSRTSVKEFHSGKTKDKKHFYHEVSSNDFSSNAFKREYQGIKGDSLKRTILKELKDSLEDINSIGELEILREEFFNSSKMEVIDKAQGIVTHILAPIGLKTDSHRAVEKIFQEAEVRISHHHNYQSMH